MTRMRRLAAVVAVATTVAFGVSADSIAAWITSGFGDGRASARTLSAPTSVTAACQSLTSVKVSWNASQVPPYVDRYQVARSANGGGSWTNVGSPVTATTATSYSLTDSSLGLGTYVWRVTAIKDSNWRTNSANSNSRTILLTACT
jgi:hypothetical protein